jgi:hypothetical protein
MLAPFTVIKWKHINWRLLPSATHSEVSLLWVCLLLDSEDGGSTFLQNMCKSLQYFMMSCLVGECSPIGSTRHGGHWLAYCTCPRWLWWWRIWWNEDWQGKPKYSEKTYPSATLSTINPTLPDLGLNPGHHGGKPGTNRLSYGVATCNI